MAPRHADRDGLVGMARIRTGRARRLPATAYFGAHTVHRFAAAHGGDGSRTTCARRGFTPGVEAFAGSLPRLPIERPDGKA